MTFEEQPSISVFLYGLQRQPWYGPLIRLSSQPFRPVFPFSLFRWTLLTSFWYGLLIQPWGILSSSLPIQPLETAFQFSISGRPFQMAFRDSLRRCRPFNKPWGVLSGSLPIQPFETAFQFSISGRPFQMAFRNSLRRRPLDTAF